MKKHPSLHAQAGINMVEIMIALLIGAFLIGGLIQLFIGSKQTYNIQDANSRLQENGRFAIEFLSSDVHEADFWGCWSDPVNQANVFTSIGLVAAPGVSGKDNDTVDPTIINGTDSITLTGFKNEGIPVTGNSTGANPLIIGANTGSSLNANDWALVTDCENANIFKIDNLVGAGTNVQHAAYTLNDYGITMRQAQIFKWYSVTYDIRPGTSGQPSLFRSQFAPNDLVNPIPGTRQELVEGIEDMQILYGEDTDADGLPNRYLSADPANGVNMDNVTGVRISILARSLNEGLTASLQPNTLTYANGNKSVTTCPKGSTIATCVTGVAAGTVYYDGKIRNAYDITLAIRSRLK